MPRCETMVPADYQVGGDDAHSARCLKLDAS
jgi:hypothetical protein